MSGSRARGFTVIEVMLFLAISGMLVIGIMAGAGAAVNVQRYKDATNSLVSYFQSQYDRVANVQNDRSDYTVCNAGGMAISPTPLTRGASRDCYIIGRLLTVSGDGTSVMSQVVYATADVVEGSDIEALGAAGLFVDTTDTAEVPEKYVPEWSTRLVKPAPEQAIPMDDMRLLIVRSPSTGTIRTFITMDMTLNSLQAIVATPATRADITACLDQSGLTTTPPIGVTIIKDASGMSGVKMTSEGVC